MSDLPVVVAGAGPTGLTSALLLAGLGVRTVVLERHHGVLGLPRAVHLDDEAARVLGRVGLAAAFAQISRPARGLRLLDEHHGVLAEFPRGPSGPHGLPQANLFDQPELERLLRERVAAEPAIALAEGVEVVDVRQVDGPTPTVVTADRGTGSRDEVRAVAVLGCDGANSVVRSAAGSRMVDLAKSQRWLVVDARCSRDLDSYDGVDQVCSGERAATFLRIGADRYRWEFRLHDGEDVPQGQQLEPLLAPWGVGLADLVVLRNASYDYRGQVADRWQRGRVFLLGDAAHLSPPFTGQGLGSGLRDALNLTWKLAAVVDGRADDALLATYQPERRPHVTGLIRLARLVGTAMTTGGRAGELARSVVVHRLHRVPGLRDAARGSATPRLRQGPLVRRRRRDLGSLSGTLLPEPLFLAALQSAGDDAVRGRWLVVDAEGSSEATRLARLLDACGPGGVAGETLAGWLRDNRVRAAVIRPDGAVAATADTTEALCRLYADLYPLFTAVTPGA